MFPIIAKHLAGKHDQKEHAGKVGMRDREISSKEATAIYGQQLNAEWKKSFGESEGPFWDVEGETKPMYHVVRGQNGVVLAGATTVQKGMSTDLLSIASHAKDAGSQIMAALKARSLFITTMSSSPESDRFYESHGFRRKDKPGQYNYIWKKPQSKHMPGHHDQQSHAGDGKSFDYGVYSTQPTIEQDKVSKLFEGLHKYRDNSHAISQESGGKVSAAFAMAVMSVWNGEGQSEFAQYLSDSAQAIVSGKKIGEANEAVVSQLKAAFDKSAINAYGYADRHKARFPKDVTGAIQAALKAMYSRTQSTLQNLGVSKIKLYRGVGENSRRSALEAWTVSPITAELFATGAMRGTPQRGQRLEETFDVKQVFSIAAVSGLGNEAEQEVIVMPTLKVDKHLSGKHDQQSHNWRVSTGKITAGRQPKDIIVYHGTFVDFVKSIKAKGLQPNVARRQRTETESMSGDSFFTGARKNKVFVTSNLDKALDYARDAVTARTDWGSAKRKTLAIVRIKVPAGSKLELDAKDVMGGQQSFMLDKVPPDWIESVGMFKIDDLIDAPHKAKDTLLPIKEIKSTAPDILYTVVLLNEELTEKHLAGKHDQQSHAGDSTSAGSEKIVEFGIEGKRIVSKDKFAKVFEVDKIISPSRFTEARVFVYDLVTKKMYASATSHYDIFTALATKDTDYATLQDRSVRFWGSYGQLETSTDEAGLDVNDEEQEQRAFDNIYRALDAIVAKGMPPSTKIKINRWHASLTPISTTFKSMVTFPIVAKHLPGRHDQQTHAHKDIASGKLVLREPTEEDEKEVRTWEAGHRRLHSLGAIMDAMGETSHVIGGSSIRAIGFVIRDEGELVGAAAIVRHPKKKIMYLTELGTKRQGYGKAVLRQLAGLAVEEGRVLALTSATRDSSRYYTHLGFTNTKKNFFEWSVDDAKKFIADYDRDRGA